MNLSYIVLYVKNVERSLMLYQNILGFEIERRYSEDNGSDVVWLVEKGEKPFESKVLIELVAPITSPDKDYSNLLIGFQVESLQQQTVKMQDYGFNLLRGPYSPADSVHICTFSGPDGEIVELMQLPK